MSSTGPVAALPTLQDVETAANGGEYESGQLVYVHEIKDYAIVWKPTPFTSIIVRTRYPDFPTFEEEAEDLPPWTPGVIITEGRRTPVILSECSGSAALPLSQAYPKISIPTSAGLLLIGGDAIDTAIDPDVPSVPTTSDLP